uniref:Uncharacterized protein n=1 Tax=Setaria viridis TaxID=4556 RepID=A0A4U6TKC5_SETVI|nr:hypothetical protein SEVIR_8G177700v2 [Setaria viridis]
MVPPGRWLWSVLGACARQFQHASHHLHWPFLLRARLPRSTGESTGKKNCLVHLKSLLKVPTPFCSALSGIVADVWHRFLEDVCVTPWCHKVISKFFHGSSLLQSVQSNW